MINTAKVDPGSDLGDAESPQKLPSFSAYVSHHDIKLGKSSIKTTSCSEKVNLLIADYTLIPATSTATATANAAPAPPPATATATAPAPAPATVAAAPGLE